MTQIGTVKLQTQNSGVVDVPVFETGDSASGVFEFVRVETASGTGFIPVTDPADATYPYLRVQSQNNGIVAVTDTAGDDIPDAALSKHDATELTGVSDGSDLDNWPDLINSSNLVDDGDTPVYGDSLINGNPGVEFGEDDYLRWEPGDAVSPSEPSLLAVIQDTDFGSSRDYLTMQDVSGNSFLRFHNNSNSTDDFIEVITDDGTSEQLDFTAPPADSAEVIALFIEEDGDDYHIESRSNGSVFDSKTHNGDSFENLRLSVGARVDGGQQMAVDAGFLEPYDGISKADLESREQAIADRFDIDLD